MAARITTALWALSLLLSSVQAIPYFFFQWPAQTSQCQVINLTWANAVAPFTAYIVPINAQPMIYQIPNSSYVNGFGSYEIQLQLNAGTNYVVWMNDARGLSTGGSSEIQQVAFSSQTNCLNSAAANTTDKQFGFTVSGQAKQCERGFEMSWDSYDGDEPYNFTVIPLDQGFYPYDVALDPEDDFQSSWLLNMTTGTRFTVMMNNKWAYGAGGTAGIYEVDNSNSSSDCVSQSFGPTGIWPNGLATNTLPYATLPITDPAGTNKGLSGGEIAGVVIGVLAAIVILALALFFLLRRRKNRRRQAEKVDADEVDLAEGYQSMIEPYRPGPFSDEASPELTREGTHTSSGDLGTIVSTAGFAGLGAGSAGRPSAEVDLLGEDHRASGPGIAGPIPDKSRPLSDHSHNSLPPPPQRSTSDPRSPIEAQHETHVSGDSSRSALKNELLATPTRQNHQAGQMRITNHDDPSSLPTLPPGARYDDRTERRRPEGRQEGPTFRRHADGGRIPVHRPADSEVVDLPPLYTDVPRDGPEEEYRRDNER